MDPSPTEIRRLDLYPFIQYLAHHHHRVSGKTTQGGIGDPWPSAHMEGRTLHHRDLFLRENRNEPPGNIHGCFHGKLHRVPRALSFPHKEMFPLGKLDHHLKGKPGPGSTIHPLPGDQAYKGSLLGDDSRGDAFGLPFPGREQHQRKKQREKKKSVETRGITPFSFGEHQPLVSGATRPPLLLGELWQLVCR